MKKALIIGISGQDGAYLAQLLLQKGYLVSGTSRDAELSNFSSLVQLDLLHKVKLYSMSIIDFRSVMQTILDAKPDEIYNLAGQTSVGMSFTQPVETLESITIGTLNILEVIRFNKLPIKFYNASSSECFGNTKVSIADENTPFLPQSPYAVSKSCAHWLVSNYREAYGMFCVSGILFNHESPLRPKRFVTRKITSTVAAIKAGSKEKLILGNINVKRDWGYAPEYVDGMWRMLQQTKAEDFILATGEVHSVKDFVVHAFNSLGIDIFWEGEGVDEKAMDKANNNIVVEIAPSFYRPSEGEIISGNAKKAKSLLDWEAAVKFPELVSKMIRSDYDKIK